MNNQTENRAEFNKEVENYRRRSESRLRQLTLIPFKMRKDLTPNQKIAISYASDIKDQIKRSEAFEETKFVKQYPKKEAYYEHIKALKRMYGSCLEKFLEERMVA